MTEVGLNLAVGAGALVAGIGMFAVVAADAADGVVRAIEAAGIPAWISGRVAIGERDLTGFDVGAKGVDGGAVRLVGSYSA